MSRYFLLLVLLFWSVQSTVVAQRVALSLGYNYGSQGNLDNAIKQFNFTHPAHGQHPFVRNGFYGSLEYSLPIRSTVFFISPRVGFWQVQNKSNSFVYPLRSRTQGLDAQFSVDYYALSLGGRKSSPFSFNRNLFFNLHFGVAYITHEIEAAEEPLRIRDEVYEPTAIAPFFGLGVGYDIFTLPTFSFTPEIRAGYMLPFELKDLNTAYTGGTLIGEDADNKSGRIYLQLGVAMRLHGRRTTYR